MDNGVEEDRERDGLKSSSTTWRNCGSVATVEDTGNRTEWRRRTHLADPSPEGFTTRRRENVKGANQVLCAHV